MEPVVEVQLTSSKTRDDQAEALTPMTEHQVNPPTEFTMDDDLARDVWAAKGYVQSYVPEVTDCEFVSDEIGSQAAWEEGSHWYMVRGALYWFMVSDRGALLRLAVPRTSPSKDGEDTFHDFARDLQHYLGQGKVKLTDSLARALRTSCRPKPYAMDDRIGTTPIKPPMLIEKLLYRGHKLNCNGAAKAGKTMFLMQLAISLSRGLPWLGLSCTKSKVLYIDTEMDEPFFDERYLDVLKARGITDKDQEHLCHWSLRGERISIDDFLEELEPIYENFPFDVLIIDPTYKVFKGHENDSDDTSAFCETLDQLAKKFTCAIVYCHHHSKGDQYHKSMLDRSSGSSVFSRDADTIIDLIEMNRALLREDEVEELDFQKGTRLFLLDSIVRNGGDGFDKVYVRFDYPLHNVVDSDIPERLYARQMRKGYGKQGKGGSPKQEDKVEELRRFLHEELDVKGREGIRIKELVEESKLCTCDRSMYRYFDELSKRTKDYYKDRGVIRSRKTDELDTDRA